MHVMNLPSFCVNCEKISFSLPDSVDSEVLINGLASLTEFHKQVYILFKRQQVADCQKKIYIVIAKLLPSFF